MLNKKTILITGSAGFIGFHLSKLFLKKGWIVIGLDGMTKYYDLKLKKDRHKILSKFNNFKKKEFLISDINKLSGLFLKYSPSFVVHLAAQAGVRYSLEEPKEYLNSNIASTFNILEMCKIYKVKHLLISSTSSVYGNNDSKPFKELDKTDNPLSIYAAKRNLVKFYLIPILIVLKYLSHFSDFLRYMVRGDVQIWLYLNLQNQF